jgi:thiol-disulfide isomerase/thioredoxin
MLYRRHAFSHVWFQPLPSVFIQFFNLNATAMKLKSCMLAMLWPFLSMCSHVTIKGTVINSSGTPVAGAVVTVLNSNNATVTNKEGEFILKNTSALDSIHITCPGYQSVTVSNNERGLVTVMLKRSFNKAENHVRKPLTIGDSMPPFLLSNIINHAQQQIDLSQVAHKLVILDFWATWCTSCLKGFAKLDTLQQLFPLELQPILVNTTISSGDNIDKITAYLANRNSSPKTSIRFPVAVEDDPDLKQLFPRLFLPHYVWLYQNKVVAITSTAELTKQNIQAVLSGKMLNEKMKNDFKKNARNTGNNTDSYGGTLPLWGRWRGPNIQSILSGKPNSIKQKNDFKPSD